MTREPDRSGAEQRRQHREAYEAWHRVLSSVILGGDPRLIPDDYRRMTLEEACARTKALRALAMRESMYDVGPVFLDGGLGG